MELLHHILFTAHLRSRELLLRTLSPMEIQCMFINAAHQHNYILCLRLLKALVRWGSELFMLCRSPCALKRSSSQNIIHSAGSNHGDWGSSTWCSFNYFMNGARLMSEPKQGSGDDSACMLTSILQPSCIYNIFMNKIWEISGKWRWYRL